MKIYFNPVVSSVFCAVLTTLLSFFFLSLSLEGSMLKERCM